ncbi:hypothetical protein WISP_101050 [Willisornis vidua]|uniref:Uncharacterized protein n=1 Tax=Willisornis vidua TaxID=1566151 RepID=A0ABQ9CYI9_9PASS|nr:hypothetical protein WISP_101050 [Willisornis vidua]
MVGGMQQLSCEERLRELELLSLEKRRLPGDHSAAFQYLKGAYKKSAEELFTRACKDMTGSNVFKLTEGSFRSDMKKFFPVRLVRHWNRLSREVVGVPSLEVFKTRLDGVLSNLI